MFERMRRREGRRRVRLRRPQLKRPAINRLIPNMLTVAALCAGMTGIRFALEAHDAADPAVAWQLWQFAMFAVIVAGVFDGLDGRIARLLNVTSKFGAELDSLSDFLAFGVAPAVILYVWCLSALGGFGWTVALVFAVCCALRLARFNTALGDPNPPPWTRNYFTGVPAPAAAGLGLLPLIATFTFGPGWVDRPALVAANSLFVAWMMVSRVPTFSIKQVRIAPALMLPALVAVGLFAAALASAPWPTFCALGVVYLASIPVAVWTQRRERDRALAAGIMPMAPPALPPGERASVPVPHGEQR